MADMKEFKEAKLKEFSQLSDITLFEKQSGRISSQEYREAIKFYFFD